MHSSFDTRLATLLKKLEAAPACDSAEGAFALFQTHWLAANTEHDSPLSTQDHARKLRMSPEYGWQGLGTPLCYVDSREMPCMRLYIHADGAIVIQRFNAGNNAILLSKPGRLPPASATRLVSRDTERNAL